MKRGLLLITCLFCLTGWGFAQERNHGIKIGIVNSLSGSLETELAYEHALSNRWGLQIAFRYRKSASWQDKSHMYYLNPEMRYYLLQKRMKGLYFSGGATFWLINTQKSENHFLNEGLKGELGAGYQFIFWNRITLDPFLRGGYGYTTYLRETSPQEWNPHKQQHFYISGGIRLGVIF